MRERPILFSAPMVQAILTGAKTVTRRIVKLPEESAGWRFSMLERGSDTNAPPFSVQAHFMRGESNIGVSVRCPYTDGAAGCRLWVKETWRTVSQFDSKAPTEIGRGCTDAGWERPWAPIEYLADGYRDNWDDHFDGQGAGKTRVSIHMPRWASRITLEVTGVRVERLQTISGTDVLAEGVTVERHPSESDEEWFGASLPAAFAELWDSINGKRPGCSWDSNPWLWVVEFKRIEREGRG